MNPLYPFEMRDGELVLFRGTWPMERQALAAASTVTDDRSELEIMTKEAPRWKVATKPMPTTGEAGQRAYGLPSRESKIAWLEERAAKAERLAEEAAKTGTAAPVRPPVPSPAECRKAVDELLFGPVVADPVRDVIWGPRTAEPEPEAAKYAEPPALHPRQAAIHGDAERAALLERPSRSVDEILFGVRRGTP